MRTSSFSLQVCCLLAVSIGQICAEEHEPARAIRVTGEGTVAAPPDMATIHTGVVTQADTAKAALKQNNEAAAKLLQTLKQQGVAEKDIQTSSFNVSPLHRQDDRGRQLPEIVGYRVQNQLRVRLRNLPKLGEVLDALVQAGSNQVSGISFGVDDPGGILDQARSRAVRDAKNRAGVYAQAAGVEVGQVRQISEQPLAIPRPMEWGFARADAAAVPIATGEQEFQVTVHVIYELKHAGAAGDQD
jgi:uncharacterized protein